MNKLKLPAPVEVFVPRQLELNDVELMPIELPHVLRVASLPHHHGDPFDRLLIAQALVEGVTLVSRDAFFDIYGVRRLW